MATLHIDTGSWSSVQSGFHPSLFPQLLGETRTESDGFTDSAITTSVKKTRSSNLNFDQIRPPSLLDGYKHSIWLNAITERLDAMLFEAGYDKPGRESAQQFFSSYIGPYLGPAPSNSRRKTWKSFMTDDFSPIEYSWVWSSVPKIRYSVELIGPDAGSAIDPFNQTATMELMNKLKIREKHINWKLFEFLLHTFQKKETRSSVSGRVREQSDLSTFFLALEPWESTTNVKAYLILPRSMKDSLEIVADVITSLCKIGLSSSSHDIFREFVTPSPSKPLLSCLCIAVDCVELRKSRLKFYIRSASTSFNTVKQVIRMGDSSTIWTDDIIHELKSLWKLVFNLPDDFSESAELPTSSHETAGILYYFDLHPSYSVPVPKVYIPVKHYSLSDHSTYRGLADWLKHRGNAKFLSNFENVLRVVSGGRDLENNLGTQTYISCAVKGGKLELTSYLSPELYKMFN